MSDQPEIVIIGAGPAGLTAAYMLTKRGVASTVLEADDIVGGISRTANRDGWRFDIGGHRFFTKVQAGRRPLVRDPRARRVPAPPAPQPHPLPRQVLRLPDQAAERAEEPRCGRGGALRVLVHVGRRCARRRTSTRSRATWPPTTAGASTTTSSRPTTRRCGASPCVRDRRPTGAPSGSRACRCVRRSGSRSGPKLFRQRRDKSKQVTSLIEEFNYPKLRPGP